MSEVLRPSTRLKLAGQQAMGLEAVPQAEPAPWKRPLDEGHASARTVVQVRPAQQAPSIGQVLGEQTSDASQTPLQPEANVDVHAPEPVQQARAQLIVGVHATMAVDQALAQRSR